MLNKLVNKLVKLLMGFKDRTGIQVIKRKEAKILAYKILELLEIK